MAHHEPSCSNQADQCDSDGCADAFATVALMTLVIGAVVFWLHSMPM